MMLFWMTAALLLLLVCLAFVLPAFRQHYHADNRSRDALNKAFFNDRLRELDSDDDQGLLPQRQEMVSELQQTLLDDIPVDSTTSAAPLSRWVLLPGVLVLAGLSIGLYWGSGAYSEVSAWQQVANNLPALSKRVMEEDKNPLTQEELTQFALALRTRLQQEPDDAQGWLLLGRVGLALGDASMATHSLAKANTLSPNNSSIQLSYAQALILSTDEQDNQQGRSLLADVLRTDHTNIQALSLLAFSAYERGDYPQAISAWKIMLKLLPEGDSRITVVQRSMAQAEQQISAPKTSVSVNVAISPQAQAALSDAKVLYVSALEAGSPIPVAAKQIPISRFPLQVTLSGADAMIADRPLSEIKNLVVRARLSLDGQAMPQSGDWYGESQPLVFDGQAQVNITIDKQKP
ncbi:MAG: c-type cytochrome biogenesis protein CcmI [Plesiomonas sp.]